MFTYMRMQYKKVPFSIYFFQDDSCLCNSCVAFVVLPYTYHQEFYTHSSQQHIRNCRMFFFLNSTAAVFLLCSFHVDDFCFLTFTCFIQKNYRKYPFTTFTAPSRILISITQMFGSRYSFTGQDGYQSHLLASLDQTCLKM